MTWDNIDVGVNNGNKGFTEILIFEAGRFQEGAVRGSFKTLFNLVRTHEHTLHTQKRGCFWSSPANFYGYISFILSFLEDSGCPNAKRVLNPKDENQNGDQDEDR
jgi:hypothetical protein